MGCGSRGGGVSLDEPPHAKTTPLEKSASPSRPMGPSNIKGALARAGPRSNTNDARVGPRMRLFMSSNRLILERVFVLALAGLVLPACGGGEEPKDPPANNTCGTCTEPAAIDLMTPAVTF